MKFTRLTLRKAARRSSGLLGCTSMSKLLSFYLNEGILKHFRTYGAQHYNAARESMYA